jgi:hypothetical protein
MREGSYPELHEGSEKSRFLSRTSIDISSLDTANSGSNDHFGACGCVRSERISIGLAGSHPSDSLIWSDPERFLRPVRDRSSLLSGKATTGLPYGCLERRPSQARQRGSPLTPGRRQSSGSSDLGRVRMPGQAGRSHGRVAGAPLSYSSAIATRERMTVP